MITGWILAGGRSSRMGIEKAWLRVGSTTLIEQALDRLRPIANRLMILGNRGNRASFQDLDVDGVLTDIVPDRGPLMGVYTGLMHTESALNVFVSCDMPWVDEELIRKLIDACQDPLQVVAAAQPGYGVHPLPLVCRMSAARAIGALLDRGEQALHRLLLQPEAKVLWLKEPRLWRNFVNINTPEDYASLHRELPLPADKHGRIEEWRG